MGKGMGDALADAASRRTGLMGVLVEASEAGAQSFFRRKYTRDLTGVDAVVAGIPLVSGAG